MSIRRRVESLEREHRMSSGFRVILTVLDEAETLEEAEDIIARHREEGGGLPIEVARRGTAGDEILASWMLEPLPADAGPVRRIIIR